MVAHHGGIHHAHIRKRIYRNLEPFPHPNRLKRLLDRAIYVVAIIGPIMTIPQVWNIWIGHQVAGISMISWATYLIAALFWLAYAIVHKEKPLIFTNTLWVILDTMIVVGLVIYG